MPYINETDRHYIENKYHRQDEPFNPYDRLNYHGYEYDPSTGLDDQEMHTELEKLYNETLGMDHALAKAKGFAFVLDNARIDVSPHDYFFGFYNWARPLGKTFIQKWYGEIFSTMPEVQKVIREYYASGTAELWLDTEHVVPYWVDIMELGFPGLLERTRQHHAKRTDLTETEEAFFVSIETEYEAILRLLERLAEFADTH
ncbi:MAG: hypothetical protein IKY52_10525, partial [Clostridia bacterium]|nr:hypothetical protein [Clostridia bacterium]